MQAQVKYPTYKETGIEWLPNIPESWDVSSLKHVCDIQLGKMLQNRAEGEKDVEVPYLKAQHVTWKGVNTEDLPTMWASIVDTTKYEVKNGDLLVCEGGEVGRASIVEGLNESQVTLIQNALHRVRGSSLYDVRFLKYLLENIESADWFSVLCNKATIAHLTSEKIGAIQVPLPSLSEQQKIVAFLEHKTSQIDALIEKKRALIEKLNEKRTAVITQAVTKGLDPTVPMKDSGVAWLGEIPAYWDLRRLKYLASETLKYGANEAGQQEELDFPRFIRITDVNEDGTLKEETIRSLAPELAEPYLLEEGDILLARSGATVGKSFLYRSSWGPAAFAGYMILFRVERSEALTEFAYYFLQSRSYWSNIHANAIQATIQNFSAEKYANIVLPLPPINEQDHIASSLDSELNQLGNTIQANRLFIQKLREYRNSLITAAVTGQIDVRDLLLGI